MVVVVVMVVMVMVDTCCLRNASPFISITRFTSPFAAVKASTIRTVEMAAL